MNSMLASGKIDRISVNSGLIVGVFLSVLLLSSQSGASFVTYLLALAMLIRVKDWNDVLDCSFLWPMLALLVYLPVTSFWSDGFSWREFGSQLIRAILIFFFVVAFAESQLRGLLQAWLFPALAYIGASVAALCLVLFYMSQPEDGRLVGLGQLDSAVIAGLVFGFVLIVTLHQCFLSGGVQRLLFSALLVPIVLAIFATGSRGAIISSFIGVMALGGAHFFQSARFYLRFAAAVFVVVLLAGVYLWTDPAVLQTLFPRGDSFRLTIWQESLNRLQSSPWFGLGILTVDDVFDGQNWFDHPHNIYLAIAVQGGVLGLALFLWILAKVVKELLVNMEMTDAKLGLGVISLALPAYFVDGHELLDKVSDSWFLIWLPCAIALGIRWHKSY